MKLARAQVKVDLETLHMSNLLMPGRVRACIGELRLDLKEGADPPPLMADTPQGKNRDLHVHREPLQP